MFSKFICRSFGSGLLLGYLETKLSESSSMRRCLLHPCAGSPHPVVFVPTPVWLWLLANIGVGRIMKPALLLRLILSLHLIPHTSTKNRKLSPETSSLREAVCQQPRISLDHPPHKPLLSIINSSNELEWLGSNVRTSIWETASSGMKEAYLHPKSGILLFLVAMNDGSWPRTYYSRYWSP